MRLRSERKLKVRSLIRSEYDAACPPALTEEILEGMSVDFARE
jgi:hypothetical protein